METLGGRDLRGWRLPRCVGCGLPAARCLCATLPTLATRARVVLVSHRVETLRSSNTARLVATMLPRATVIRRGDDERPEIPTGRRLVLFPFEHARPLCADDAGDDLTLVVPDGTWSQARRIARRDELAREAPAVTIPLRESAYGLRRNPRPGAPLHPGGRGRGAPGARGRHGRRRPPRGLHPLARRHAGAPRGRVSRR